MPERLKGLHARAPNGLNCAAVRLRLFRRRCLCCILPCEDHDKTADMDACATRNVPELLEGLHARAPEGLNRAHGREDALVPQALLAAAPQALHRDDAPPEVLFLLQEQKTSVGY